MKNKIIISIILLSIPAFLLVFLSFDNDKNKTMPNEQTKIEKIKIAACPTYYDMAKKLDLEKYEVIVTASTAESIELMKNKQADLMLAGRTLKPGEPKMDEVIIKEGYSFISNNTFSLYKDELNNYSIYTDLDINLLKRNFPIGKIEKVNNIYNYLDKGIIITSWDNTDYAQAKIVHVLENSGKRVKLSRRPTIYCPLSCDVKMISNIVSSLK